MRTLYTFAALFMVILSSVSAQQGRFGRGAAGARGAIPQNESGVISGNVLDEAGRPISNARVTVFTLGYLEGRRGLLPARVLGSPALQTTNGQGDYRLTGYPSGEYYIRVDLPVYLRGATSQRTSYFPGTPDVDHAIPVVLSQGQELTAIDIKVPSGGFTVSGKVVNPLPGGTPRPNGMQRDISSFVLLSRDTKRLDLNPGLTPAGGVDGNIMDNETSFVFQNVPPGSYELWPIFGDQTSGAGAYFTGGVDFEVRDRNVEGLVSTIQPNRTVAGRVVVEGAIPTLSTVSVQLVPEKRVPLVKQSFRVNANAAGTFVFAGVSNGRYKVAVSPGGLAAYVSDIRQGATSVYDSSVIDVGADMEPLEVVLRTDGGVVSGMVSGAAPPLARVVLIPEGQRRDNSSLYGRVTILPGGRFSISNVAPGQYKVFAFDKLPAGGAEESADFIAQYESRGRSVTVSAGLTVNDIQVDLIEGQ